MPSLREVFVRSRVFLRRNASLPTHITTRSGEVLHQTTKAYNESRKHIRKRTLQAVCYAPFLSMDFDATGAVRLCNHSHTAIAQVSEDVSVLDVWRGAVYRRFREDFARIRPESCRN